MAARGSKKSSPKETKDSGRGNEGLVSTSDITVDVEISPQPRSSKSEHELT